MSKVFSVFAVAGAVLGLSLLAGFSAPNTTPAPAKPAESVQPAKKKVKIGVSVPAADHGWTAGVGYWAKRDGVVPRYRMGVLDRDDPR